MTDTYKSADASERVHFEQVCLSMNPELRAVRLSALTQSQCQLLGAPMPLTQRK
jgi:hypothetical protein